MTNPTVGGRTKRGTATRRSFLRGVVTAGVAAGGVTTATGAARGTPLPANPRWDHSPDVRIRTDGQPAVGDDDQNVTRPGSLLAEDAVSDYWDDTGDPDGESDRESTQNVPSSWTTFDDGGFGSVSVGSGGAADVTIRWANLDGGTLGETSVGRSDRTTIGSATVTIDDAIDGATDEDYKNVIAHELGHAIGLGHSGSPRTLMHPFLWGFEAYQPLGPSSIGTLDRLYG